jgi:hypothetical protein
MPASPNIKAATRSFESWLGSHIPLIRADLNYKHQQMASDPVKFLRATFYRWAQQWPVACPDVLGAPRVLAVGDLHVENFGSWRDAEGRLVWGINDLDEACVMPYTNDLVRLATSARLTVKNKTHLNLPTSEACAQILRGYTEALRRGGEPVVLERRHAWLRRIALDKSRDAPHFWAHIESLAASRSPLPEDGVRALRGLLPKDAKDVHLAHRRSGMGSLGRVRIIALAMLNSAPIAREAKAMAPSAWNWSGDHDSDRIFTEDVVRRAVRCPDPLYVPRDGWLVRRLAPDCSRIDLGSLSRIKDDARLLHWMGWETANIHLGNAGAAEKILTDLESRPSGWLRDATMRMSAQVQRDFKEWRQAQMGRRNLQ